MDGCPRHVGGSGCSTGRGRNVDSSIRGAGVQAMSRHPSPFTVAAPAMPKDAGATLAPTLTREPDGTLVIRLPPPPAPSAPDELVPFPFGNFERNAARSLMREGHLPVAKIGRKFYARRSDVLALVERVGAAQARARPSKGESADDAYRRLVGKR